MSALAGVSDDALLTRHAHYTARIREAQEALDAVNDEWTARHQTSRCPEHCGEPAAPFAAAEPPVQEAPRVVDLMAALEASLAAVRSNR